MGVQFCTLPLEYAALVALIALVAIAGVRSLEEPVKETVCKAVDGLDSNWIWWEDGNCYRDVVEDPIVF